MRHLPKTFQEHRDLGARGLRFWSSVIACIIRIRRGDIYLGINHVFFSEYSCMLELER